MNNKEIGYTIVVMASIVIVLAGIKSAAEIIVPFLLSLFLAIILLPAYNFFIRKGLSDTFSLLIVLSSFLVLIAFVTNLLGSSFQDFSSNIDFYEQQLMNYYASVKSFGLGMGIEMPYDELSSIINSKQLVGVAKNFLQGISSVLTNSFVVLFLLAFMLLESNHFMKKIEFGDVSKNRIKHLSEIVKKIKEYMVLKAITSFFTGLIIWIALEFVGTDYPFLWAVLAFLLNFIPNIGSIIASVPPILLTLVQLGGISAIEVAVIYVVVNVLIGSVIEPKVMGNGLGLSTLVVFLSLLFWGWLLGTVGMLLSIPLTIMAKIIFDSNENTKWVSVMLGSQDDEKKSIDLQNVLHPYERR